MAIYIFVFLLILIPLFFKRAQNDSHYNAYFWFEYCILFLLMGLRFRVGGDSLRYELYYSYHPDLEELLHGGGLIMADGFQPLWVLFQATCKSISNDFFIVQLIHAIVVNGAIFYYANNNVKRRFTFVVFYYLIWYPYFNTEIMRESLAVSCFLFGINYLQQHKYVKYYFVCIVAFLFHASAVFLFILPLIYPFLSSRHGIKAYIYIVIATIFVSHYISNVLSMLDSTLFAGNSLLSNKGEEVIMSSGLNIFGIIVKLVSMFPVIWTLHVQRFENQSICNFSLFMYILVSIIGMIYLPLVRLENYFAIIFLCIFTDTITKKEFLHKYAVPIIAVTLILLGNRCYYYMRGMVSSSGVSKEFKMYERYIPYHSIFNKAYDSKRERAIENQF